MVVSVFGFSKMVLMKSRGGLDWVEGVEGWDGGHAQFVSLFK